MSTHLHRSDLPDNVTFGASVAIDTETMGLNPGRDRLCLVQMSAGDGVCHLVQIAKGQRAAPNLVRLLGDPATLKIFHFARFDLAILQQTFGKMPAPVYCTKIASRLTRTFTDRHGLKDLAKDLVNVELSKQQQSSDWGADDLTQEQLRYAASDVLYPHRIKAKLDEMLRREGRTHLAQACFDFLATRVELDLMGWGDEDIFAH
jgi:ribonuclease D